MCVTCMNDQENNLSGVCNKPNFKMQVFKIGKNSTSKNFQKFAKILNNHKIRMIYGVVLQFSGFTSYMDTNKW